MDIKLAGNSIEEEPLLRFDREDASCKEVTPMAGLSKFGSYVKDIPSINIALISSQSKMRLVEDLVFSLNNGDGKYFGGMQKLFRTVLNVKEKIELESTGINDYIKATETFVSKYRSNEIDIVIIYVPKTSDYDLGSPYYRCKGILACSGFPSQMVTYMTFDNLSWSYLNLACGIFTKIGGIPWTLYDPMPDTDMIIGISSSYVVDREDRTNPIKYVGYVNVFDEYGRWIFFDGTAEQINKDNRERIISELIGRALKRYISIKGGLLPKNVFIHYSQKFGKSLIKNVRNKIRETVDNLDKKINVGYVCINSKHPFRLYDKNSRDGSLPRGEYSYLNDRKEILFCATGISDIGKKSKSPMGTPKLLHVRFYQEPTEFTDIDNVAKQVFGLTKLNWATAHTINREPITISFSRELAKLTASINHQEWGSILKLAQINSILSDRPWFV